LEAGHSALQEVFYKLKNGKLLRKRPQQPQGRIANIHQNKITKNIIPGLPASKVSTLQ
jgi:hypothetical protein